MRKLKLFQGVKKHAKVLAGVTAGLTLGLGTAAAFASIPDANGVIHGCIRNNGDLRIIDTATQSCTAAQDPISFNQTGPQGPAGPQGPQGPAGEAFVSDLTNATLNVAGLSYRDLSGRNLSGTFFLADSGNQSLGLKGTDFTGANLSGTSFMHFPMDKLNFSNTNLSNATFDTEGGSWQFSNSNFVGATLSNTTFTDLTFVTTNFEGVNMSSVTFTDIFWVDTTCPDGTNSDNNGNTCVGHLVP